MKKIIFIHDSKFYKQGNRVYNNGNLSYDILKRYLYYKNKLLIIGRLEKKIHFKTRVDGENINWCLLDNIKSLKGLFKYYKQIKWQINREIKDADLVIIRLPSLLGIISYKLAKLQKKKIILEVVGNSLSILKIKEKNNIDYLKTVLYSLYSHYKVRKITFDAENIIYVTKDYLQYCYPNKKNNIACSDVIINHFYYNIREKKDNIKLGMLGFIGNKNKGLDVAIKAMGILSSNYTLEIVGGGDKNIWEKEIEKLKNKNNIIFRGELDHSKVIEWLKTVDILLQPSYSEGLPRAILEAMSTGCAVVGTNIGGIPELVNKDLLIKPGDYITLAKKIKICTEKLNYYSQENLIKIKSYSNKDLEIIRKNFIRGVLNKDAK